MYKSVLYFISDFIAEPTKMFKIFLLKLNIGIYDNSWLVVAAYNDQRQWSALIRDNPAYNITSIYAATDTLLETVVWR